MCFKGWLHMCINVGYTCVLRLATHMLSGWLHMCFKVGYTCVLRLATHVF